MQLLGTNGDVLVTAGGIDCFLRTVEAYHVPQTGTYTVLIGDDGGNDLFNYGLTLVKIPGSNSTDSGESGTIAPGQTVAGAIGAIADIDVYAFAGVAGDSITANWQRTGGNGQNSILQLHSPTGIILSSVSGGTSETIRYECVPNTGTYFLLFRDDGGDETSSYLLSLAQTPGPPPSNDPPEYLQVFICSGQVIVRWSTNAVGFRLQSTTDLTSPPATILWSNIPPPYPSMEGFHFVTNRIPAAKKFFRLINP